jgi:hypothetical protein
MGKLRVLGFKAQPKAQPEQAIAPAVFILEVSS